MYKFVKGSRLFMQGTREGADFDNVHDTFRPTMSAAGNGAVDRSRGGSSNGHHVRAAAEDDDLGRAFLSRVCVRGELCTILGVSLARGYMGGADSDFPNPVCLRSIRQTA